MTIGIGHDMTSSTKRRPHTKSCTGCSMCKKRRVKCDESRPTCKNCLRFSSACDYTSKPRSISSQSSSPAPLSEEGLSESSATSFRRPGPGRPRKDWNISTKPAQSTVYQDALLGSVTISNSEIAELSSQDATLNTDDLELLYHYLTSTCETFSDDPPIGRMYRVNLPRLGLAHPFVLRLLLALAGRHLLYLRVDDSQSEHYLALAEKHFAIALPQVTLLLSHLDVDNCQALYAASIFICFYMFAKGPAPGEYLVFSENGTSLWLALLRGVRSITEYMGPDNLYCGLLAPMRRDDLPRNAEASTALKFNLPTLEWKEPFRKLRRFISSSEGPYADGNSLAVLDTLAQSFEATYGSDKNGSYNGEAVNQVIFRWMYLLEDDFIQQLQRKRPQALIIVAYFALLMRILDLKDCWFLKGWSDHILLGIDQLLEESYRVWLDWPMEQAGLGRRHSLALGSGRARKREEMCKGLE